MNDDSRVSTALLLAAGTGSRLRPLTENAPKCLTEVGGIPILGRLVESLRAQKFNRIIVVLGHQKNRIREYLKDNAADMQIDYVINADYRTTNNIYSLWLARKQIRESFLLVESDLVFEASMLTDMLQPDKIAISRLLPWMNGTTVRLATNGKRVQAFHIEACAADTPRYKTVNLYSLSLKTWHAVEKRLGQSILTEGRLGEYYETVFADMVADGSLLFDAVFFDEERWYEIDNLADLNEAEKLYNQTHTIAARSQPQPQPAIEVRDSLG